MFSLYHVLLAQHARQLTPIRCAEQTITNLHRLFEDVVLDNNLAALVIGTLPPAKHHSTSELGRIREIGRTARDAFFFATHGDELHKLSASANEQERTFVTIESRAPQAAAERFVVIADARFSALLVSVREPAGNEPAVTGDQCLWTFEPDIVYSALEYLMARATAESPTHAAAFSKAVSASMPKVTSPQLTISVTTRLARLLQEQSERMHQQAFIDDLTECFNGRFFRLQLEREIAAALRISQPLSLIMLDVDPLEPTGDAARRMLADILREELRVMDVAARLDSGEFVLILPQTDAPGAFVVAERLRAHVARVEVPGVGWITASFGIAAFPVDAGSLDQLMDAVTRSFQDAQRTGRNHVRLASNLPTAEQLG